MSWTWKMNERQQYQKKFKKGFNVKQTMNKKYSIRLRERKIDSLKSMNQCRRIEQQHKTISFLTYK